MTNVIRLSDNELTARIAAHETKWPDFASVYAEPTCCPGCMVRYDEWGSQQINDWNDYYSLRWLNGDDITYEEDYD